MAKLIKYISDLLHFHDCVIVPGLGGFVANHKPATILVGQNLFLPPAKEIGFNRSLAHHDGLLIDYVARREAIPYQEAMLIVERFVAGLKFDIISGKTIDLDDIGTLRGDAIGSIQFSPREGSSFLPDSYGLTSFRFEPLDYKHVVKFEREMEVPRLLRSRSPKYWSAVAAMVTGLFFLATLELNMPDASQASMVPLSISVSDVTNASVSAELSTSVFYEEIEGSVLTPEETVVEIPVEATKTSHVSSMKYHLIGASFPQHAPANRALNAFIAEGFNNAHIVDDGKGRFRIALQSFEHREDALTALEKFRSQPRFSTVWVFRMK